MTELTGMTPQELSDWCKAQGMPAFRGKQIFRWIHQGADFDAMTNLPAAMRAQLKEIAVAQPVSIIDERKSQIDDTVKFLFGLKDGNCVEGVLMHYHHGYTLCISTQVGCRMGCKFCASTLEGGVRSLTASSRSIWLTPALPPPYARCATRAALLTSEPSLMTPPC